jgi:Transposase
MLSLPRLGVPGKIVDLKPPEVARCPRCGTWSPRNEIRSRFYWEPHLLHASTTEVRGGCYLCPDCPKGAQWFMLLPEDYKTGGQYSLLGRMLVVDLVRVSKMSAEQAAAWGRDKLHLPKLDATTVLDWLRESGDAVDREARLKQLAEVFSGQMSVDEVYDGGWYQLKATDPLNGLEIAWKLERGQPSKEDVRQFFQELKDAGFEPDLVSTDGSELYPDVIKEVWPNAEQQRCVFHFVMQVNKDLGKAFWAVYKTLPEPPKRKRGRPKKRGRPRKDKVKRENREKVRKARWIFPKRESNLSEEEQGVLQEAIELCPGLGVLRRFVLQMHELFGPETDSHELATKRREAILNDAEFLTLGALAKPLERFRDDDLWARLTRYLDFENADKTSNHAERENREFRKRQKTHYRMRSRESLRALLALLSVRRPVPTAPVKLIRRERSTTNEEELVA